MTVRAAVFDFDDTLIPCKKYFTGAKAEFLVWLTAVFAEQLDSCLGEARTLARNVRDALLATEHPTQDVDELLDGMLSREAAAFWLQEKDAIEKLHASRSGEGWAERVNLLQAAPCMDETLLLRALGRLKNAGADTTAAVALRIMAHAIHLEEVQKYHTFRSEGQPYNQGRFPLACLEAYLFSCHLLGARPEWEHAYQAEEIGRKAFHVLPEFLPGAEDMLDYFRQHARMALLTKGPRDNPRTVTDNQLNAQWRKYEVCRMTRWIPREQVRVVSVKTPRLYRELIGNVPESKAIAIGNDYDGDLAPAKGLHRIWIPVLTWFADGATRFEQDLKGAKLVLDEKGAQGWLTKKKRYLFRVDSATLVPSVVERFL